ncbi:MAG: hypothetical protein PVH91_03340, partial [Pseudomonadales bacterium]
ADEAPTRDPSRRGLSAVLLTGRRMSRRLEQHVPGSVNYGPYLATMFPDTSVEEVTGRVTLLADCLGMEPPTVRTLQHNVFAIAPAGGTHGQR